jgi:hypothetical protein
MPIKPSGTKAPARSERSVTTPGASIQFSATVNQGNLKEVPALIVNARRYQDTAPKDTSLSTEQLSAITDLDTLKATVTSAFQANRDYLEATATEGKNATLGTAGARKQIFFDSIENNLARTGLSSADHPAATRLLRQLKEATWMGHTIEFDTAKLDSYHSYYSPFDTGVRKLAAIAPKGIERDNIRHEVNYITDRKTQHGYGPVNERDAEVTLRLRAIDRGNNNQAISLAKDSQNPLKPVYVVININQEGLPEGQEEHAGKAVIRDGERLLLDQSSAALPDALKEHLTEKSASSKTGLRLLKGRERPRKNFPYNWNKNKFIDLNTFDTSWWGHCHIEAPLAALAVQAGSKIAVYDNRSKVTKKFKHSDVNDLLFAMLDAANYSDMDTSQGAYPNRTSFVGNRNDTTGGARPEDRLILQVNGSKRPFSLKIIDLFDPSDASKKVDRDDTFSPTVLEPGGIQFKRNPTFLGLRNTDWSTINGERKISAEVEYIDVSPSGSPESQVLKVVIDPRNPSEKPVLVGSALVGGGYPSQVKKYYLNETTNQLESKTFAPEKQADNTYKMVPTSEEATIIGDVSGRVLSRELVRESIIALHNHVLNAARRGVSFVTEKSSGNPVWNYGTKGMHLTSEEQDGDFTRYTLTLNTQGGEKKWSYILQYDQAGTPIDAHALEDPVDFVWRPEKSVSAPLYRGDDGRLLFNASAYERGFLLDSDEELSDEGLSFFRYASDVIYASLADPKKDERFVVIDTDGELYFYDDLETYKAEVSALGGDPSSLSPPPAPAPASSTPGANPFVDSNGYPLERFHAPPPARPTAAAEPNTDNGDTVPATFRTRIPNVAEGDTPVVVGNVEALGAWDPQQGIEFSTQGGVFPYWSASVDLPTDATIEFKWAILRSDGTVEWEEGPNRTLATLRVGPSAISNGFFDETTIHWRDNSE